MAATAQSTVSPQVVGNAFVKQYYQILHHSPELVHRFYQEISKLGRPEGDGPLSLTTTMQAINEKILSLNFGEYKVEIKSVDAQESFDGGVHVLVTGCLEGKDNLMQNFTQTFFLAPQEKGYFVLNDMFQYVGKKCENGSPSPIKDVEAPLTLQQEESPVQENHILEQTMGTLDANGGKEVETADIEQVPDVEEEVPVPEAVKEEVPLPEVVNEVPDIALVETESNSKTGETAKKSYASIVMVMKDNPMPISSPPPRKHIAKSLEQASLVQPSVTATETPAAGSKAADNGNHQDGEADGYSVYIKGLPMNATPAQLEDEFKKYGSIKYDGIQVRSNNGFCFGFVEFEEASAAEKAMEASPVRIGGRLVYIEEKKSTNTRASHRGRYSNGRGGGFRYEGYRSGGGDFGNYRAYNNGGALNEGFRYEGNDRAYNNRGELNGAEFNGRSDFGNRGNSRGGGSFSSQGGGGRSNQGRGTVAKHVFATA